MSVLIVMVVAFGLLAGAVCLNGLVLKTLWAWFLVPIGVQPVGVVTAIGISLIVHLVVAADEKSDKEQEWEPLVKLIMRPLFALAIGWVVRFFA